MNMDRDGQLIEPSFPENLEGLNTKIGSFLFNYTTLKTGREIVSNEAWCKQLNLVRKIAAMNQNVVE